MVINPVSGVVDQLRQLNTSGHHLIVDVPNSPYFLNQLKEMETRANNHVQAQLEGLQAHYEAKQQVLDELIKDYNEALIFATESARLNFEWYFDQLFMRRLALDLELRQVKAKIKAQADEMVAAWQATAESLLAENEGLRDRLGRYQELVRELKRVKKPERVVNLVAKFEE